MSATGHRIGIDLGGTKTEAILLAPDGTVRYRQRVPTLQNYDAIITCIATLVQAAQARIGAPASVGVGIPGCISPASGLVKGANTQCLNGRALDRDLSAALGRAVRVANDANCFALSEASDGAGAGKRVVFGVILGTGCGGGVVVDGRILPGAHSIGGEWGHNPLPWPRPDWGEIPGPRCWCGQHGCMEAWVAGPALTTLGSATPDTLCARAATGDAPARTALHRHTDRLARGLAGVINLLDPDAIVLGGGLSNMAHLYTDIPALLPRYVFSDVVNTPILPARHGDSSGVRGAAWLWPG